MSDTSSSQGAQPAGSGESAGAQPSIRVLAQYAKDLSFENPQAPASLQQQSQSPKINIDVNVTARGLSETDFEVTLKLQAQAGEGDSALFHVELDYAGIFRLQNMPKEHIHPFLLIEAPRMLFPFARQIVAEATRNGGFPPLMIDPVDFAALYRRNLAEAQNSSAATN
ncbi:protein-export chaperone SecB [Amorphus orientalis]|uniref:Protein-export protein SecB n=1 Tax=Amorphus orientalis TaxID=649198 RepID=A0AAE4AR12_9HYPH|nr:protein-export chaperone SecB [Amorphus orientalis]MDQ0313723.1 preprotein translocase subunit SecB [Amorphus orientalis]